MNSGYIAPGCVLDGYLAASRDGLYDAVDFTYRPSSRTENIRLDAEIRIALAKDYDNPAGAIAADKLVIDFVTKRLVSWSIQSNGEPIQINADSLCHISPELFHEIYRIIRRVRVSDSKPAPAEFAPAC